MNRLTFERKQWRKALYFSKEVSVSTGTIFVGSEQRKENYNDVSCIYKVGGRNNRSEIFGRRLGQSEIE